MKINFPAAQNNQNKICFKIKSKNNLDSKSDKIIKSDFDLKTRPPFYSPINRQLLISKFNINFASSKISPSENLIYAQNIQRKIETQIKPLSKIPPKSAITSPDDIEIINKAFENDKIGSIFNSGICLNAALQYLANKKQIKLQGENKAFMIENGSLEFLKWNKIFEKSFFKKMKNEFLKKNVIFYCYSQNKNEALDLIEEFRKLTGLKDVKVKIIQKPKQQKIANYPKSDEILKTVEDYAKFRIPNNPEKQKRYIKTALKYLNENILCFSYQKLCEEMRNLYNLIKTEVKARNKTMDDVIYLIPESGKSYDLINYFYARENDIDAEKFKNIYEIVSSYDEDKIYVVLDDLSSSGQSLLNFAENIFAKYLIQKRIIFAPLISSQLSEYYEEKFGEMRKYLDIKIIPLKKYDNLACFMEKYIKRDCDYEKMEKYLEENFENLDLEDINFLLGNIISGYGHGYDCVNFPYMIPDNSTEINTILGKYFLNYNSNEANRGIIVKPKKKL